MISQDIIKDSIKGKIQSNTKFHFTLNIYKGYKLRIHKPLLLVKLALFFWFAGSFGKTSFIYVFLKQRGLSVADLSLAIAASAIFQFLGASLSGVIADKIGRSKPVLCAQLLISILMTFTFMLMPPLASETSMRHFELQSNSSNHTRRLMADSWCNISDIVSEHKSCKLYFPTNVSYTPNKHCLPIDNESVSRNYFNTKRADVFENTELCCQALGASTATDASYTICNSTFCEKLEKECMCERGMCSNSENRRMLLLSGYTLLVGLDYMSVSSTFRFYDLVVKSLVEEHRADFGKQRVFSILGTLVGPSMIGYALHFTSSSNDRNYSLAFVFSGVFTVLSFLSIWSVDVRVKLPGRRMLKKTIALLKKPDTFAFALILLVLGTNFNFINIYSSWYLEDLGASKILLGLFTPLSNVSSLLLLLTSKWWVQTLGEHNLFIVALLGHGLFGVAFSFLKELWLAVLFGAVAYTFSYHLLWVAVIHYAHSIAPEGLYASVFVTAGTFHFSASRITASLIGGMIMDVYGGRIAFRVMGIVCFITSVLYGSFHYIRRFYFQNV